MVSAQSQGSDRHGWIGTEVVKTRFGDFSLLSRSELQNGQPLPSVSQYTDPNVNNDGSVDIYFSPEMPGGQERNWIQTVPGHGWFPIFRLYGPLEPFFDKTWELPDIERL